MKEAHEFSEFVCSYPFEGGSFKFSIFATGFDDAEARLRAIQNYGTLDGQLMGRIPAVPGAGLYVRLKCWWENLKQERIVAQRENK